MRISATATVALVAGLAVSLLSTTPAEAHGRRGHGHRHSHVSVGVGFGYPGYYRPYGYYGGYYYPRSYLGFSAWPRYRTRRVREAEQVRNQALYVYPAAGQTEQQMADDRYDCHVWSVDSTGFDPTLGAGTRDEADNYARAFTACMEGRDYVVR